MPAANVHGDGLHLQLSGADVNFLAATCRMPGIIVLAAAAPFRAIFVDEFPDSLRPRAIYIAGETGHAWAASMVCPCGCGDMIQLNLLPQVRPCWQVETHEDGTVSIAPSVWRQQGCRSHFFVRRGRIDWC